VPSCCSTYDDVADTQFNEKIAQRDLARFRKKGPEFTARLLRDLVTAVSGSDGVLADQLPLATTVTLDRVICCYPSFELLLEASLRHTDRCFAFSYPRDTWYVRLAIAIDNGVRRIRGKAFRTFVHPADRMRGVIARAGFRWAASRRNLQWSADVYVR
jgi:magnesium-protoporphyrin O-methyltransferase